MLKFKSQQHHDRWCCFPETDVLVLGCPVKRCIFIFFCLLSKWSLEHVFHWSQWASSHPTLRLETWIACSKADGNGPADRGARDHDLCDQPHSSHAVVSSPGGPTWSPYFWSFAFSPVLHIAAGWPFLEPSSDYITASFAQKSLAVSLQIKSSCLSQQSWCCHLWSQWSFLWNAVGLWTCPSCVCSWFRTTHHLPQIPVLYPVSKPLWAYFCPRKPGDKSSMVSAPGLTSFHMVPPWVLGSSNTTSYSMFWSPSAGC